MTAVNPTAANRAASVICIACPPAGHPVAVVTLERVKDGPPDILRQSQPPGQLPAHLVDQQLRLGADGGAGLGLAIVRGIVEAHQGQVRVVNAGDGCRFEIRLPALAPDCGDAGGLRSGGPFGRGAYLWFVMVADRPPVPAARVVLHTVTSGTIPSAETKPLSFGITFDSIPNVTRLTGRSHCCTARRKLRTRSLRMTSDGTAAAVSKISGRGGNPIGGRLRRSGRIAIRNHWKGQHASAVAHGSALPRTAWLRSAAGSAGW